MTIYDLKPRFQNLLKPITRLLAQKGVTANTVTIAAILLSALGGFCAYLAKNNHLWLLFVPIILFVRMALNAIDGMLAREHNMQSNLGAILNELGDVISDVVLYAPFAYLIVLSPELVLMLVFLSIIIEMTGVVAVQIGATRRYDGPFGKSDRAFLFGLVAVLLVIGFTSTFWLNLLLIACVLLSLLTIYNRAKKGLQELDQKGT